MTTAGWYSLLQILSYSCCIFIRDILLNLVQIEFLGINITVRIGDCVACAIDDGGIRVSRRIGLTDNAVGYTAMLYGGICVLVDVECTIGQSRCTAEIKSTLAILVENTGVGTGYRRSYAVCVRVEACSDTAHTLSAIILVIEIARNGRQQFIIRCFILN